MIPDKAEDIHPRFHKAKLHHAKHSTDENEVVVDG